VSRYREEGRVNQGSEFAYTGPKLTPGEIREIQTLLHILRNRETSYSIDADQNNFRLARGIIHRFTTDASRTITGFNALDLDSQIRLIVNVGATNNLVLANENVGSASPNRIITHTGSDITLGPNESVLIFYDRTSARVRTVGF
jgi:hypothetical protein